VRGIIAEGLKIETGKRRAVEARHSFILPLIDDLSVEFLHPILWSIES
jgi:hypothetical protein